MRLLLDESVPVRLREHLAAHQVATVAEMGWGGSTNGALLALASQSFDALTLLSIDAKASRRSSGSEHIF